MNIYLKDINEDSFINIFDVDFLEYNCRVMNVKENGNNKEFYCVFFISVKGKHRLHFTSWFDTETERNDLINYIKECFTTNKHLYLECSFYEENFGVDHDYELTHQDIEKYADDDEYEENYHRNCTTTQGFRIRFIEALERIEGKLS